MKDTYTVEDTYFLRLAIQQAKEAREHGNHPFGAVLVSEAGEVLLSAQNTVNTERDATGHAETNLMRKASRAYSRDFLRTCIMYTSTEPCAMCSGATYWAGVGKVVYGLSESELYKLTGDNPENLTMHLPCREVLARGQQETEVVGPLLEDEAKEVHQGFW
ncbi:tRNA-specific adenosine deaminase [candidate division KSB3 bacterium]|uniref:tRNA-specific adenosine deaminase n=1 Tax=candidate division KSB3 bacterium TaxID=2044937 RepID=A0A2G6KCG1_9BACT|nr:MAG: tRNA-specific adenosine deaminase [candidate division KSB3 bacterium]